MDACDGGDMGFQQQSNAESNPVSQEASVMAMSSIGMMPKPSSVHQDPFFSSGWDPLSSMAPNHQNFGCPPVVTHRDFANLPFPPSALWENHGMNPHLAQYPPHDKSFLEMVQGPPGFVSRGLPDMLGAMGLPQYAPISVPETNCASNVEGGATEGTRNREGEAMGSPSTERRRKRTSDSSSLYDPAKNSEVELQRDPSWDTSDVQKEHNEKKHKTEQPESTNSRGKQSKDDSNSGEPPKDNYIHVRARRGQATNSHSLAERVRREKISERMRMLQELVPGCNKITGKALMLDEIINYVQSLQQQVEFLSMKLSTLLPDLSIDLERVLSKELLQARGRDPVACGLGPGTGLPLPYGSAAGNLIGGLPSTSQYPSMSQAPLDNELQTLFQMGFDSAAAIDILKQNGRLKSEQ